jgi:CO/xanthine dehydrogenase FAD-binding subunit
VIQTAYVAPSSWEEALTLLDDTNHLSMPLAGGTQLLVIDARIAVGAIALISLRATRAETSLLGEALPLRETVIDRCVETLAEELPEPLHDIWASASYRVMMAKALVKKAIRQAMPINDEQLARDEIYDQ